MRKIPYVNKTEEHRMGCTGNCLYCQILKRRVEREKEIKKRDEAKFCWDEASVIL